MGYLFRRGHHEPLLEVHIYNKTLFNFFNEATNKTLGPTVDERFDWDGRPFYLGIDTPVNIYPESSFKDIHISVMPDYRRPRTLKVGHIELSLDESAFREKIKFVGDYYVLSVKLIKIGNLLRIKLESERKRETRSSSSHHHHFSSKNRRRRFHSGPVRETHYPRCQPIQSNQENTFLVLPIRHKSTSEQIIKRTLSYHGWWSWDIMKVIHEFHRLAKRNNNLRFIEVEINTQKRKIIEMIPTP